MRLITFTTAICLAASPMHALASHKVWRQWLPTEVSLAELIERGYEVKGFAVLPHGSPMEQDPEVYVLQKGTSLFRCESHTRVSTDDNPFDCHELTRPEQIEPRH